MKITFDKKFVAPVIVEVGDIIQADTVSFLVARKMTREVGIGGGFNSCRKITAVNLDQNTVVLREFDTPEELFCDLKSKYDNVRVFKASQVSLHISE